MSTNKEDNISEYTDRELYQILDVNNPTDRELEAKINQLLDQYENTDMTMYKFITKIYHHFFEIESDSEAEIPVANNIQEGFGEREESIIPTNLVGDPDKFDGTLFRGQNTPDPNSMINKSGIITNLQLENNPNDPNNQQIIYQQQLTYTPGVVNPLLKETISRIINIDSKFRDTIIYPYSSDFTFNLSETLNNVVRIKLYSVQIPYTWYTIDTAYGSNFFYIQGNQLGIAGNSLQITIPSGNYTSTSLITAINTGFQNMIQQNTDINFGNTCISYNIINNFATFTMNIQNIYNENNYYLEFPKVIEPIIDQYIYYTTQNQPYIYFTYFTINISPYILHDFITDISNTIHTIQDLSNNIGKNLQTKIISPTLRNIATTIYDSSYEQIEILFNLNTSQNNTINNLALFNINQLEFITDLCSNQLTTFFSLTPTYQSYLTQNILTSQQIYNISQIDQNQLQLIYTLIQSNFTQQQYIDISNNNQNSEIITNISQLSSYYLQNIVNLYTNYSNNQLDVLYKYHHSELNALAYISDISLSILRDISYTLLQPISYGLINQNITKNQVTIIQNIPNTIFKQINIIPQNIWSQIVDISNIQTLYSDISGITTPQYQYLSQFNSTQLSIFTQLTITTEQYQILAQLTPDQLSYLYELPQSDINSLYKYTSDLSGATKIQNQLLSTAINKTYIPILSTLNNNQLILLQDISNNTSSSILTLINEWVGNQGNQGNQENQGNQVYQQFPHIKQLTPRQITLLSQLTPTQITLLSQLTPTQITNVFDTSNYSIITILSQLNSNQIQTINNLTTPQLQTIYDLNDNTPQQIYQILVLSAVQIAQLSQITYYPNVNISINTTIPNVLTANIDNFLVSSIAIAKLRLTTTQMQTIQYLYQAIYTQLTTEWLTQIYEQSGFLYQYSALIYPNFTIFNNMNGSSTTLSALPTTIINLLQNEYYYDLTNEQQTIFNAWSDGIMPPDSLPSINPPQIQNIVSIILNQYVSEILYSNIQYMSQWTPYQTLEWNVFYKLDLTNSQLQKLSQFNQDEITQITNFIYDGSYILNSISNINPLLSSNENLVNLIRYSEYRKLFYDMSQNPTTYSPITFEPSRDITVTIPAPIIDAVANKPYYGWQTSEWIEQIQQQFQNTPTLKNSIIQVDYSLSNLSFQIINDSSLSGYYMMSFYDPVNYPQNTIQTKSLVWDSSGEQNVWYKYLHFHNPSEIIISDTLFTPLPYSTSLLLNKEKDLYISGNFQAEPTQVTQLSTIIHTLPELFGYEYQDYHLYQIRSNTFHGNFYNYSTVYPNITISTTQISLQLQLYVSQIHTANPLQPISQSNYTYTDTSNNQTAIYTLNINFQEKNNNPNIGTTQYSYYNLIQSINQSITQSNIFTSDSRLWIIDESNQTDITDISNINDIGTYRFVFTLKPERKNIFKYFNINNQSNIKYRIQIQDPLWTNQINGFKFLQINNELSNIVSETSAVTNTIFFTSSPTISFMCTTPGFMNKGNDISFSITPPNNNGYTYTQYLDVINTAFQSTILTQWGLNGNVDNNQSSPYNANINFNILHTIPQIDKNQKPNFTIDFSGSIFSTFTDTKEPWIIESSGNQYTIGPVNIPGIFKITSTNNSIHIKGKGSNQDISSVFDIPIVNTYNTYHDNETNIFTIADLTNTINTNVFGKQSQDNITMYGSYMSYNPIQQTISMIVKIQSVLTNNDYKIVLSDSDISKNSWQTYLHIPDSSYNISDLSVNTIDATVLRSASEACNNGVLASSACRGFLTSALGSNQVAYSTLSGNDSVVDRKMFITQENNYFILKPTPNSSGGVYINTNDICKNSVNDIIIQLSNLNTNTYYSINDVVNEINYQFTNYTNYYGLVTHGSYIYLDPYTNYTVFRLNINTIYTTRDYVLDFFDPVSFTQCTYGKSSSIQAVKWDTTLGWLLGFHNQANYLLTTANVSLDINTNTTYYSQFPSNSYTYDISTNIATLRGDTIVNVTPFNSFFLLLDDYTQSHINDGLVTVTQSSLDIPLASYAVRNSSLLQCELNSTQTFIQNSQDPVTRNNMTSKQIYSVNQLLNANNSVLLDPYKTSLGPNTQDIFAIIPLKLPAFGQSFIEFGGTLQNQDRSYFGPVNLKRINVRLLTDKGTIINLNNADWSIGINVEQLYNVGTKLVR